jgi:hypothetical protein
VSQLVASVDAAFDAYDARAADPAASSPWFVPFDPGPDATVPRDWIREGEGVLAVDSPPAMFDVLETFEEAGIRTLVNEYFGEAPTILSTKLTLRRVEALELYDTDYHQDGAFLGGDVRTLDVWVTLSDCGVDAPGMDIVAKRFEGVIATQREGAEFDWTIPAATVDEIAPGLVHRPVFAAGDAMIFDHLLVHRTARDAAMRSNRYAIEAWFSTTSKYPASAIPIAYSPRQIW